MIGNNNDRNARRRLPRLTGASLLLGTSCALAGLCLTSKAVDAQSLQSITIGKAVDTIPFTVVDVAIDQGFFKQNGLDVKEVLVQGSSAASAAMVGGSLQFALEAAVPLMLARSKGVPLIAVDAIDSGVTLQFLASKTWLSKHPIPANADLKQKMADLNGGTLGQVGTTDQAFFGLVRGWAGLPAYDGYHVEQLESLAAVAVAMQKGIVDVTVQSPPQSVQLAEQGDAVNFVDRKDVPQFNDVAYDLVTTTTSYAQQNPKVVQAVATSIAQALNFMRERPDETLAVEQKHFPKLDKAVLQKSVAFIPFAKDGLQSQKAWDSAVMLAQQTGFVKDVKAAPENDYWTNKYIDTSKLGH
ncbi:MAG TPA: ABC transporter substrate-binding protein [Beijerinckiaceae bacterium]|nr:ABC transporter substrate-binding protein [Beijerinckiaceae bacterium]